MKLFNANNMDSLKELQDNSIDSIVTDPPYGLSFMNKHWDYDVPQAELWSECLRVLKPGGHLLAFFGTRTYHRGVVRIEDAGFEIRDQIQWIYGSGFPKSHNIKEGDFKGWGTSLKPANEPIVVARKPLEKGLTIAENVVKYGTGAINIDECRIGTSDIIPSVSNQNIKGAAFKSDNSDKDRDTIYLQNPQGRWPANILFDEQAAMMLDEQHTTTWFGSRDGSHIEGERGYNDSGGASRFFYVAKASKSERNKGLEGELKEKQGARPNSKDDSGKFPDHDHRPTGGNNHPTVKPIKLMEYLIKLVTPPKGTVLDPFMGSGSTGVAAKRLGFDFVGIELSADYFEIAEKRIQNEN